MKPRGTMMIEHRLIEKMLDIAKKELEVIEKTKKVNPVFIDTIVDFIKIYADRTYHGKEEVILSRELEKKKMNPADTKMMQELVDELERMLDEFREFYRKMIHEKYNRLYEALIKNYS
ncbi:MAG: hypothetical protein RBT69_11960 [Spirochaetia bacterium]|nr:hypothetical protein [Spirochaetia bacterium]